MPTKPVPRRQNAVSDAAAIQALGLSRRTFFRKLKDGSLPAPVPLPGTSRRWWTPAEIEVAREALEKYGRNI